MKRAVSVVYLPWILFFLQFVLLACVAEKTAPVPKTYGEGSVIAVWDLEDMSVTVHPALGAMQEFLSARISETLSTTGGFELVERQKLILALEELSLGSSSLASQSSRLEVGRVLGAQLMVFGGYQLIGKQFRVDLRMVEVASGVVLRAAESTVVSADMEGWLGAAEQAAVQLIPSGE
ncbi:CsgG/HfaB family protein [Desulfopila sp. IMCC35008]|uniref:CsgG/HfaB family protein n=1 Tax=Desulfopila sp. IMCC35008 TaxID=2653858 RepID=UPI0013D48CFF|nr:CsgG/HfaB family protein [Desulfopila sp. IMCC35008]